MTHKEISTAEVEEMWREFRIYILGFVVFVQRHMRIGSETAQSFNFDAHLRAQNTDSSGKKYYEFTTVHPKLVLTSVRILPDLVDSKREIWWGWRESNPRPKV